MYYKGMTFTQTMFVERKTVGRTRNRCCNTKATMRPLCIVELHVNVKNKRVLSAAQSNFMANL
jgi:hypothetical protein